MVGTALNHYRITKAVGIGGMGEVYATEDTKLHRQRRAVYDIAESGKPFAYLATAAARNTRLAKWLANFPTGES